MAKSARASTRKANNRRLKQNVFGPVESARTERLSAKLLDLAAQPKPQKEQDVVAMDVEDLNAEIANDPAVEASEPAEESTAMDVEVAKPSSSKPKGAGKIQKKRKTSRIVFPKYKDRKGKK
ncbi:hypothetical protein ACHAQH_003597 [Verticillium albo-atrum]